jgi:hypothetical protein
MDAVPYKDLVKMIGGARVGWFNATWPLARLKATKEAMTLDVFPTSHYIFEAGKVTSIERYVSFPVIGWGIKINHVIAQYPQRIIFWHLFGPQYVLRKISSTGFKPQAPPPTFH